MFCSSPYQKITRVVGYMVHIGLDNALAAEINFDGETRGPQNIVGFVALVCSNHTQSRTHVTNSSMAFRTKVATYHLTI